MTPFYSFFVCLFTKQKRKQQIMVCFPISAHALQSKITKRPRSPQTQSVYHAFIHGSHMDSKE